MWRVRMSSFLMIAGVEACASPSGVRTRWPERDRPWVAFTGLTVRGAGSITYGFCLGMLHAVYRLGRRGSLQPLVLAIVGGHASRVNNLAVYNSCGESPGCCQGMVRTGSAR